MVNQKLSSVKIKWKTIFERQEKRENVSKRKTRSNNNVLTVQSSTFSAWENLQSLPRLILSQTEFSVLSHIVVNNIWMPRPIVGLFVYILYHMFSIIYSVSYILYHIFYIIYTKSYILYDIFFIVIAWNCELVARARLYLYS